MEDTASHEIVYKLAHRADKASFPPECASKILAFVQFAELHDYSYLSSPLLKSCDDASQDTARHSLWLDCSRRHAIRHIHSQGFLLRRRSPVFIETRNNKTSYKLPAYLIVKRVAKFHRFTLF